MNLYMLYSAFTFPLIKVIHIHADIICGQENLTVHFFRKFKNFFFSLLFLHSTYHPLLPLFLPYLIFPITVSGPCRQNLRAGELEDLHFRKVKIRVYKLYFLFFLFLSCCLVQYYFLLHLLPSPTSSLRVTRVVSLSS